MPLLKANEPLPPRSVVIGIYGEPGVSKTTIANTSEKPLLLDFDRGVARSFLRKDTLIVDSWQDVINEEATGLFKGYKTIIIDTAKSALDDFLMAFVIEREPKLRTNKLQAYGQIGEEFKLFTSSRRNEGIDIIIIAHAKKDEDTKKQIPDVTGQSYGLMLRVSDQIGYVSMVNNKRSISWNPTDVTVGKNTASLPVSIIPAKEDPALHSFMAGIISQVKESIVAKSEAQMEDLNKSDSFQKAIAEAKDAEDLNMIVTPVQTLPAYLKTPLNLLITNKKTELHLIWNKEAKAFEADPEYKPESVKEESKEDKKKTSKKTEKVAEPVQEGLDFK